MKKLKIPPVKNQKMFGIFALNTTETIFKS